MKHEDKNTAIYIGFDEIEPFDPARPEKNLLRAVLISAMTDLRKGGLQGRRAREFFIHREEDYLFGFQSICAQLDIDPKLVLMVTGLYPKNDTTDKVGIDGTPEIEADELSSEE